MAMKNSPVIVVGAGAAGLAAAFRLKQAGLRVKIIEAAHVVGGKLRSKQHEGFVLDQGAYFMPTNHRRMVALATEAGFADQIDSGGSILSVIRNGSIHAIDIDHVLRDFLGTRLFSARSKLSLLQLAGPLWQSRKGGFEKLPQLADVDIETADVWARRELNNELAEYVVGLILRGMSATSPAAASRVEFLCHLATVSGTQLVACRGGMGTYSSQLAAGMDVELNAQVLEVVGQKSGVRVTWRDHNGSEYVESAAGCVVAGSTKTVVDVVPGLDAWRKAYLGGTRDKQMFIVNAALSKPPAGISAMYVLVPGSVHPTLSGIGFDHNKAPGRVPNGKGLITLVPIIEWSDALCAHDDERILKEAFTALDSVIPGILPDVEFAEVTRWSQRFNPVGHYRDIGQFRGLCGHQDTNIQLAGDYFGYANLESAIQSGERAALNIVRTL